MSQLTESPARYIDNGYLKKPDRFWGGVIHFLQMRLMFVVYFLPLLVADLFLNFGLTLYYSFRAIFSSDETQDQFIALFKQHSNLFTKSIIALVCSSAGLISPKYIITFFLPNRIPAANEVHAGGNYYTAQNVTLKEPDSEKELQALVQQAAAEGKKILIKGAGFSQGKQFLPANGNECFLVDLKHFKTITVNEAHKTAVVGAGATWFDVKQEINKFKLALQIMQASDVFSVGGSLGTNIHGWNVDKGMLSSIVTSLTVINAQGNIEETTPEKELFHNVIGGNGLCGIITKATIQLTDNIRLTQHSKSISPLDYVQHFREEVETTAKMHLYRLSLDSRNLLGSGVSVSYINEEETPCPLKDSHLQPEQEKGKRWERIALGIARFFPFARNWYWANESKTLIQETPTKSINEIMCPPIKAMFTSSVSQSEWLQEFFLPEEKLPEFIKYMGILLTENKVNLINATVRFVKQNSQPVLSYAKEGDRFALVICFTQKLNEAEVRKTKKWIRLAQHQAVNLGGAFYLPYQHVSKFEDFQRAYPGYKDFIAFKNKVDPQNLFCSAHFQELFHEKPQSDFSRLMSSPALQSQFTSFLKRVLHRVDSQLLYKLLNDILKYADTHEEIYMELSKRMGEIKPGVLGDFQNIRASLSSIKKELTDQMIKVLPTKPIDGLIEIGYPGRFVPLLKSHTKITGKIVAVYEQPSITDYIQTGFPRPYHEFAPLDYSNPNLKGLEASSADVVTCFVGLHHFPQEKLIPFLKDIKNVLKPNGHFLLVDHDAQTSDDQLMARLAHIIFNVVTGVSLKDEISEIRNFHPMSYWIEALQKVGLVAAQQSTVVELIREGDPSRNRMIAFQKPLPSYQLQVSSREVEKEEEQPHSFPSPIAAPKTVAVTASQIVQVNPCN